MHWPHQVIKRKTGAGWLHFTICQPSLNITIVAVPGCMVIAMVECTRQRDNSYPSRRTSMCYQPQSCFSIAWISYLQHCILTVENFAGIPFRRIAGQQAKKMRPCKEHKENCRYYYRAKFDALPTVRCGASSCCFFIYMAFSIHVANLKCLRDKSNKRDYAISTR